MTPFSRVIRFFLYTFLLIPVVTLWFIQARAEEGKTKKLIYYGWGIRDTQYIRDNWRQMEEMPFNGTGIHVAVDRSKATIGNGATNNQLGWQVMARRPFRVEEFREAIADLKIPKWQKFTDNFLPVALSPSLSAADLNWFDEERWRIITNNFGVLSKIAAEGGLKGLIFDPEHYGYSLFSYLNQRQQLGRSFEEYVEVTRRRGREVMMAISSHLPRGVMFSLFGYTLPLSELKGGKNLKEIQYSLMLAFYDGLLEAMPDGACIIDGYEFAYGFKERRQFQKGYQQIRQEAITLSSIPNRYREKVRAAFGLMLDHRGQQDYFTPEELREALISALELSDRYVWIYSQGPQFFPPSRIDMSYIQAIARVHGGVKR